MKNKQYSICTSLVLITLISGCNTNPSKSNEETGTTVGAIVAALGCNLATKSKGIKTQSAMTVLCAFAGGYAGKFLGAKLDDQDREKVNSTAQEALATGKTQSWTNPDSGASGHIEVLATTQEQKPVEIAVLRDRVEVTPPLDILEESTFTVRKGANVRSGPNTGYKVVDRLSAGQTLDVVAKVKGENWFLISRDGNGNGYVHSSLLRSTPNAVVAETTTPSEVDVVKVSVATAQKCRTTKQVITDKNGKVFTEDIKACYGPNGWEVSS